VPVVDGHLPARP